MTPDPTRFVQEKPNYHIASSFLGCWFSCSTRTSLMAFNPHSLSPLRFRASFLSLYNSQLSHRPLLLPKRPLEFYPRPPSHHSITITATSSRRRTVSASGFTWDDVFKIANPPNDSPDLRGFFDRVTFCNRGSVILSLSLSQNMCACMYLCIGIFELN